MSFQRPKHSGDAKEKKKDLVAFDSLVFRFLLVVLKARTMEIKKLEFLELQQWWQAASFSRRL